MLRGVLAQDPLASGARDSCELLVRTLESGECILGTLGNENFAARAQELVQPLPRVTQQRGAAGGRFE